MRCMACGAEMMLMNVVQDDTMAVPGFEHHTFKCSECKDVEQRLVFTKQDRDGDTKPMPEQAASAVAPASTTQDEYVAPSGLLNGPVEPAKTVPVEPTLILLVEPTKTAPVEPAQTTPVETTVPVETTQTVFVQSTIQNRQPVRLRTNAWAKALEKLHKRETAAREAASETERHAEFNHFWDNLTSIPSPSASSEALSHVKPDEPCGLLTEPINSPAPTARDEPSGLRARPERPRRRWSWRELVR
jgi:hypothetical protein